MAHRSWNTRVVAATDGPAIASQMRRCGCSPESIDRMLPEVGALAVALEHVGHRQANLLKREMLAVGGDAAVHRNTCAEEAGKSDAVLLGTRRQFQMLGERLGQGPSDLPAVGREIEDALQRHARRRFEIQMGAYRLEVGPTPMLMGVVNVTPDSFSDGGLYLAADQAVVHAQRLVEQGADIVDVGGESTRPGSDPVAEEEEMRRVLPVVETLAETIDVPISIDTRHARVAREAASAGASLINDITGLQGDAEMARTVAQTGAGVVIMHILGTPKTMQDNPRYDHLMADICRYLRHGMAIAEDAGVPQERIIVDPGIGFGKTLDQNLEILARLGEIRSLGRPILVGPSRKRFIGEVTGIETPAQRTYGTAAACALAVAAGASMLRVHDVAAIGQAVGVAAAITQAAGNTP